MAIIIHSLKNRSWCQIQAQSLPKTDKLQIAVIGLWVNTLSVCTHTQTHTNLYMINLNLCSAIPLGLSVSMATHQQNTPQMCWNRVTVAEVEQPCQTGGYGNRLKGLCGMIEANESRGLKLLSGSATPLRPAESDVIWLYEASYLRWWNVGGREDAIINWLQKKWKIRTRQWAGQDTCALTHTHIHTKLKDHNNTSRKDSPIHNLSGKAEHLSLSITALTQSKIHLIKIGSVQFCRSRISHQWRL